MQDTALHGMITYFYDESEGTTIMQLARTSVPLDAERSAESFLAWNKAVAYAIVGQCLLKAQELFAPFVIMAYTENSRRQRTCLHQIFL